MSACTMSISEFMSGEYKLNEKVSKGAKSKKVQDTFEKIGKIGAGLSLPLVFGSPIGAFIGSTTALAAAPEAIPASATQYIGAKTLETIAHALDPLVELMVALSFPVCSVIIVGSCFFFMFGKSERAWSGIQNAGLGYVLMQIMPMLLNVLKEIGSAI